MLIFAVLGLLMIAVLAIPISNAFKPSLPRSWLIALGATAASWVIILFFRLSLPTEVVILNWSPEDLFHGQLMLVIDYQSWPFALALITISVASIFTDTTRPNTNASVINWQRMLLITLVSLVAIFAGNPLTIALAWTLVDLIELFFLFAFSANAQHDTELASPFLFRLLSIVAVIGAVVVGWKSQPGFGLHQIPDSANWIFLLAVTLRLGIVPYRRATYHLQQETHSISVFLRFAPAASALVLLQHLEALPELLPDLWLSLASGITVMVAVYASLMFATRESKAQSQPYWIASLSAFSILSVLHGNAEASRVWGLALLLTGSMLFLFEPSVRRIRFLPIMGLVGLVGVPFTLVASGWEGLGQQTISLSLIMMILAHAMLVAGYLRYIYGSNTTITSLEKHARITFPMGLVFLLQTILILGIVGWPGVLTLGQWWLPLISLFIVAAAIILVLRLGIRLPFTNIAQRLPFYRAYNIALTWIQRFFSFEWAYALVELFTRQIRKAIHWFTQLLEGDGGILWSMVLLIALITIFVAELQLL